MVKKNKKVKKKAFDMEKERKANNALYKKMTKKQREELANTVK